MGGFLHLTGFNLDIPVKIAVFRKSGESPNAGRDHSQFSAHKPVPVTHSALLFRIGLDMSHGHPFHHIFDGFNIFG